MRRASADRGADEPIHMLHLTWWPQLSCLLVSDREHRHLNLSQMQPQLTPSQVTTTFLGSRTYISEPYPTNHLYFES